ncbi:hypothetical protein GCM10027321_35460 [Massilia terrae]|uniref:Uncharacterized protein n=1 Tax=Massilia terrae TaxID=1811224 RepID=A0ABT2D2T4_9BURK|nr:hypothetical protein [Massilia terrae]MCS0660558.1 hypothetical protein [Massilia terrae]
MMKKSLSVLLAVSAALALSTAHSHGTPTPNHGGIVQAVGDTWLELVPASGKIELYVEDDGDPMPSAGLSGHVSIQNGSARTDYVLKPAGGNKLEAVGAQAAKGAKVIALVVLADKTKVPATFVVK